jgi:RNA polymerase sigma-70 factor (ECF subfamily)
MKTIRINDHVNYKIDEVEVIKRILSGEKELYEILVRRNNQKLYRIVRSYLKDESEIEDIMQNSYLKAYHKLYQFKLDASFSTWLIRIGINESLKRLKEKGRLIHINEQMEGSRNNNVLEMHDIKQLNPHDKMIQKEAKQFLEDAIDNLDSKYRIVYIMKEVEEMSLKEIAVALDLSLSNVKVRLHRSKEMLKDNLFELTNDKNIFEFGFSRCDNITENVMSRI